MVVFNVLALVIGFIIGYVVKPTHSDRLEEYISTINHSREASIELNKQFNDIYNKMGILAMGGNEYAITICQTMQQLTHNIKQVSKALGLDCREYNEDGKPLMIEDENGQTNPVEILPEKIKIVD